MASFTGGPAIREILGRDYDLTTRQIKETMDYLQSGSATFKGFKNHIKGYGVKGGKDLDTLQSTIRDYISSGATTVEDSSSGATTADVLFPGPTLPLEPISTFTGPLQPGNSPSGYDIPAGYVDDLPEITSGIGGTGGMSVDEIIALITAGLPEPPEPPELPDFETMLSDQATAYEDALAEAQAGYNTMFAEFEAEQAAAAEEAKQRRLTEMSNMAQGGQIADFKAIANAKKERGGTSQFKRSSRGLKRMPSVVNRSLSIGARNQLPGIGRTTSNYGNMPGILSQKAGSFNRRFQ